jgi:gamma-glutamyltranspeptidase/glutathione hydrolase
MTPTIVLEDGKLRYVLGTPGGSRIITTVANICSQRPRAASTSSRPSMRRAFTTNTCPTSSTLSRGSRRDHRRAARWATTRVRDGHWSNGECIAVDPKTGELLGGQDHRSHYGKAAGY